MAEEIGQNHSPFVGRDDHRAAYQQMLRADTGPWMLLITGQGGNGKSRLLRQLQIETPASIQTGLLDFANDYLRTDVLNLIDDVGDCLQPLVDAASFRAFRQEAQAGRTRLAEMQIALSQQITISANADAQGLAQSMNTGGAVNEMRKQVERMTTEALLELARAARGRPLTLLLDTREWFHEPGSQEVGVWLKDALPRLRERLGAGALRVVAAGREGLERLFPFEGCARRRLDLLPFAELDSYLRQIGMGDAATRRAVFEMTRGHPLCASIVAQVWLERPFGPADLPAFQGEFSDLAVTQWVSQRVLDRLQSPYADLARYGVLLRSFDLPLLRAVFPELLDEGDQVFRRLTGYSFIIRLAGGRYAFHDLLRQVQADYLRRQMPERWREYHRRALSFWQGRREQVFGRQLPPADGCYHALALDEQAAASAWERTAIDAAIIGEKDYWSRLLQAAHDSALAPGQPLQATRAFHQGRFFYYTDQWDAALASYQQALALYQQVGDRLGQANTRKAIGEIQQFQDQYDAALASYQQALALYQQVGDRLGEANTRRAIGDVQRFQDQYAALASYQQALALYQQVGDRLGQANTRRAIGNVQQFRQELDAALASYRQALILYQQVGERLGEAYTIQAIGDIQFQDDYAAALASYQQALALFQQVGSRLGEANSIWAIGESWCFQGQYGAALASYRQALTLYQQAGSRLGEANCYKSLGLVFTTLEQHQEALHYYAEAEYLYQQISNHHSRTVLLLYRSITYEVMGNQQLAISDIEEAIKIAHLLQLPQLEELRQRLAELRGKSGN